MENRCGIEKASKNRTKNAPKSGTRVKTRAKTHKRAKTHAKTRAKTQNKAPTKILTHVDFGSFFGRPGFPQKLALLLQPLPGMTGAAENNFF